MIFFFMKSGDPTVYKIMPSSCYLGFMFFALDNEGINSTSISSAISHHRGVFGVEQKHFFKVTT